MKARKFQQGEVIFREGETSTEAYRILSGEVEITIGTQTGPKTLAKLDSGEFFGEMSLIDEKPRSATATALSDCQVEVFDEDNFMDRVVGDPGNLHVYLCTLFERIRGVDALLRTQLGKPAAGKSAPSIEAALRGGTVAGAPSATPAKALKLHLHSLYDKTGWKGEPIDIDVTRYPFRIGRAGQDERRSPLANNDLSIHDEPPFHISRNHCSIEHAGDRLIVHDRGSTVGTIVNNVPIGSSHGKLVAELKPGKNVLVLGSFDGPHHFDITVS